ncbi:camp-regulated phosphoprotein/endosulfine conserved region-domain-containing protein [Pisolithus marmoratus]|nr:camp-regulated phosphoprotein/endosulfine conserved region-domain-containing protein [Pisolithus marmoratus]
MLPAKRNKIDISTLTEEEQKLFRLYGKLPSHKNVLSKMQKDHRKYFDSGDYALSKAGKVSQTAVGTAIPSPENIPHASSPPTHQGSLSISPTNSMSSTQSSLAHSESETKDDENDKEQLNDEEESASSAQNFNATQCNLGPSPGSCAV